MCLGRSIETCEINDIIWGIDITPPKFPFNSWNMMQTKCVK